VAANSLLRERVADVCAARSLRLKLVAPELCTDNAAMIGAAALELEPTPFPGYLDWDARA
jgi:N6-L-threonylcarbamoyladenine synthase